MFAKFTILWLIIGSTLVSSNLLDSLLRILDNGIILETQGDSSFKLGLVALPVDFLCDFTKLLPITERLMCHICFQDCLYSHNLYGGQCGKFPGKKGKVCVCNDSPPSNNKRLNASDHCGKLTVLDVIPLGITGITDALFAAGVKIREAVLACLVRSVGCDVDCYQNHQFRSGECRNSTSVTDASKTIDHCKCSY